MDNINMKDIDLKDIPIKEFKAEITSGDLIHAMTHAATRDDIANLRTEVKDDISKLDTKIDHVRTELKEDISRLDTKIDKVNTDLSNKIDSNFKWLASIVIVGILVPIALHFIK